MKTKHLILLILCLGTFSSAEAQLLKKLKKRAEQAAERTILNKTDEKVSKKTGKTIDDATSKKDKSKKTEENEDSGGTIGEVEASNTALTKNTEAKHAFYKEDVVIKLHENGNLNQIQYFDAEQVAVRLEQDSQPKLGFMDSEGFMYGYNVKNGQYEKSSLISLQSQGMMVPTMLLEAYKLPPEPFMANLEKQQDQDVTPNPFNGIVEFAFVYEPEQFRYEDFKESKQSSKGKSYTKFEFLNEPGYEGSYVLFDDKDRLVEIYTNKKDTGESANAFDMTPPGESLLVYEYKSVDVELPSAVEVKSQGQGMMEMMMGSFKKDKNTDASDDDYDTSNSKGQVKSIKTAMKNHKTTAADLPDAYEFDWFFETEMITTNKKAETMDMNFLIKEGANYQGMQIVDANGKGNTTMLFDSDLKTMVMFTDAQGQKFLQMFPIPEVKADQAAKNDFNVSELPSKTIIGYTCKGLQMEDEKYIVKMYHTTEAPIKMGNFMSFSGSKQMKLPDIDPRLLEQFSNGLIMEMEIIDKKKAKNNMVITAKRLNKKATSIKKSGYKTMDLFGASNMFRE